MRSCRSPVPGIASGVEGPNHWLTAHTRRRFRCIADSAAHLRRITMTSLEEFVKELRDELRLPLGPPAGRVRAWRRDHLRRGPWRRRARERHPGVPRLARARGRRHHGHDLQQRGTQRCRRGLQQRGGRFTPTRAARRRSTTAASARPAARARARSSATQAARLASARA